MRHIVRVQTDGGLKTGLDVVKAAIIGAESFGFGTAPMVALGCKYLRICHLNNCATGVATQHSVLRSKYFIGMPEMVMNYFRFVAQEVREILAELGVRSVAELIGKRRAARDRRGAVRAPASARPVTDHLRCGTREGRPAVLHPALERAVRSGRAGREDGQRHAACDRRPHRRPVRICGEELQPLDRRARVGRDRASLRQLRDGRRAARGAAEGLGRPELRRLERGRARHDARRRRERLRRQGHGGRQARAAPPGGLGVRGEGHADHGQHLPVRCDRR